jgi:ABC-2 type transport system permease protein
MIALGRYYLAEARNGLLHDLQYRAAAAMALFGFMIEPVVYLTVWRTVAQSQGGSVGSYTIDELTAYYVVWSLVRAMNLALTPYSWEWRIRQGRLNEMLTRPIHPFHRDFAFFAGQKLVWIGMWIPFAALLWLTFRPQIDLTPVRLIGFVIAIWAAFAIRSMFMFLEGAVNFWTTRTSALFELMVALELLLGGRLVPLALMPTWVENLAGWLHFKWTFQFPIEALIGKLDDRAIVAGLGMQALWILIFALAIRLVWGRAIRRYAAVGG